MIELLRTTAAIKRSAVCALLADDDIACVEFDAAAASMWQSAIPVRLMVSNDDLARARRSLWQAGFRESDDGDWDPIEEDARR